MFFLILSGSHIISLFPGQVHWKFDLHFLALFPLHSFLNSSIWLLFLSVAPSSESSHWALLRGGTAFSDMHQIVLLVTKTEATRSYMEDWPMRMASCRDFKEILWWQNYNTVFLWHSHNSIWIYKTFSFNVVYK